MATLTLSSIMSASSPEVVREQRRQAELPSGTFEATLVGIKDDSFRGREGHTIAYQRVAFKVNNKTFDVSLSRLWFKFKGGRERVAGILSKGDSIKVTMTSFKEERTGRLGYDIA